MRKMFTVGLAAVMAMGLCSHIPESHRQMIMADNARRLFFDNQR